MEEVINLNIARVIIDAGKQKAAETNFNHHNPSSSKLLRMNKNIVIFIILFLLQTLHLSFAQESTEPKISITAAVPRDFPPHYSIDKEGNPTGFAIDLMNRIGALSGLRINYIVKETWSEVDECLRNGDADLIPNIGITDRRKVYFDFSSPVELFPVSIFVQKQSRQIEGAEDLAGHRLAAVRYNVGVSLFENRDDIELFIFNTPEEALFALLAGEVDALVYPEPIAERVARRINVGNSIKIVGDPLLNIERAVAVKKGNTELLTILNPVINNFVGTSEYRKIYTKWFGKLQPFLTAFRILVFMGALLVLALTGMAIWRFRSVSRLNHQLIKTIEKLKQAKNELILKAVGEGIFSLDLEGKLTFLNSAAISMVGYTPDELVGKRIHDRIHHLKQDGTPNPIKECRICNAIENSFEPSGTDEIFWRKDGTFFPVEYITTPIEDNGKTVGIVITFNDITARRHAEDLLKESEERYRSLFEYSLNGFALYEIVLNEDGQPVDYICLEANKAFERLRGLKAGEIISKKATQVIPDVAKEPFIEKYGRVASTGEPVRFEQYVESLNKHYEIVAYSPRKGQFASIISDITDRKLAEEKNHKELMRLNLLNQITQAIAEKQDPDSVFLAVLQHLEDYLGVDFSCIFHFDLIKKVLIIFLIGPKSRPLAAALSMKKGSLYHIDQNELRRFKRGETLYTPDTAKVDLPLFKQLSQAGIGSLVTSPMIVENRLNSILLVGRRSIGDFDSGECDFLRQVSDHTALAVNQKRLYEELQQAYDEIRETHKTVMEQERLRALGQMASGIAHDINNSLSSIVGFPDLLLETEPSLSPRVKKHLKILKMAGMDIANTVNRMREFYRKREIQDILLPVDLKRLVEETIELTRPRWETIPQESGVVVDVMADLQDELLPVAGVESEIREALTNLILNAVDAMPHGGTITVRTSLQESNIILEVIDMGIGMDEETKRHCFEPFYTTKGEHGGTGLGMGMVYGVMQRHEGEIEIKSEIGKGTTIRLLFPIYRSLESEKGSASSETETTILPLKILCIDDEPFLRELMKDMLKSDGHTVKIADGGQKGLDDFHAANERNEPFDVIITDLGMPYFSGREVIKAVRLESPATPIILLTGWGGSMKEEDDDSVQADYVLNKPPTIKKIRKALQQVMDKD